MSEEPPSRPPHRPPPPGSGPWIGPPGGVYGPPGGLPLPSLPPLPGLGAPLGAPPGGGLPGAAQPIELPDLQAAARAAIESVLEREPPEAEAKPVAEAAPPPPPPPPGWGAPPPPPPGVWRAPRPAQGQIRRTASSQALRPPGERDRAQRIADAAYPLYQRLTDSKLGVAVAIALFGLVVPVLVLRQSWDVRLRIVASLFVTWVWVSILAGLL